MAGRDPGREYVPPVQVIRVRFAKRGRFRFASHRDFQRAFERALRRAEVPMAYSAGFSPHPKISYAGAAPTGAASEAEYLQLALVREVDPAALCQELDAVLPEGMDIIDAAEAPKGSLADSLQASRWRLEFPYPVAGAVAAFEGLDSVLVTRVTKSGRRELDVRAACIDLTPAGHALEVTVRHGDPTPRPGDVVAGLRVAQPDLPDLPVLATRLEQGPLQDGGGVGDPLRS